MKTAALLVAASVLFTSSVWAQYVPSTNVPPPPGINDPGVKAVESAAKPAAKPAARQRSAHAASSSSAQSLDLKPQALPAMRDEGSAQAARDQPPEVRIHQEGDNSIQEYSRNGRVYMVVITPRSGIAQTYMVDPQGRLVDEHGQKPVGPVMYKVLEWGKSRPPAEGSTEPAPADGGH
ncbi:DUF2782 domain-containing protein [Rhodanobacter sp. B2A1Ga4]|uniref:DUF2782 domain-containing protein n=1 Tax=Rhodanobacter TaxID=75309 RepID=UPI000D3433BA|nr:MULTISPECIES: DUF2782 domain-containing protein [Rhodanobacter]MBQ4854895.1 DUF2782 domain-containing protein [Rhodanobacter sp. B2A1Ga4]